MATMITLSCGATITRRTRSRSRYGPHRIMVEAYYLQRDTDIRAREVAGGDEDHPVITFRQWITDYQWEQDPELG